MQTTRELVSANSGRRHYRYVSELGTSEVRIRHDKRGWRYRIDDGEESQPYSSLWEATNAAYSVYLDAGLENARYTRAGQRVPKGSPPYPGAQSRLHGVTLEWLQPEHGEANPDDRRSYSATTHDGVGTIALKRDGAGHWRFSVRIGAVHEAGATAHPDADRALDAASSLFFKEAKRAAKRR